MESLFNSNTSVSSPLISILIPTYNNAEKIEQWFQTIISQSYLNLEFIFSDNCSSDDTFQLTQSIVALVPNAKSYRQSRNLGALGNFNFLISQAKGEFFCIAPVGDSWSTHYLSNLVEQITLENDFAICIPRIDVKVNNSIIYSIKYPSNRKYGVNVANIIRRYRFALRNVPGLALYGLMRTQKVRECYPLPIILGGDISFLRILWTQGNISTSDKAIFSYSARDRWNSPAEDRKFFFGDTESSTQNNGKIIELPGIKCSIYESNWFRKEYRSRFLAVAALLVSFEAIMHRIIRRSLAQLIHGLFPHNLAKTSLLWIYCNLFSPKYLTNIDSSLFYAREVLPVFNLRKPK